MVEAGQVGGTCANSRRVPSNTLLAAAAIGHEAAAGWLPGIAATVGPVDLTALVAGKDLLVGAMRQGEGEYSDLAVRVSARSTGTRATAQSRLLRTPP